MEELLLIPGPVAVAPDVLEAVGSPMRDHRGPRTKAVFDRLFTQMQEIFQTREQVLILASSGTGGLEAALVNVLSPGDRVVAAPIGYFGDRFANIARAYGARVEVLPTQWGERTDVAALRAMLRADTRAEIKAVLLTHNETSTGGCDDVEALAAARGDHPALLLVDSVSGVGAVESKMDEWGLDVVVTASQKALGGVPGAAMIAFSSRAWQAAETATMPRFYFDARTARTSAAKGQTPYTPPVSVLLGLERAADNYLQEGRSAAFARHARYASAVRAGCTALGLEIFARPEARSNTVTTVRAPEGIDVPAWRQALRERHGVIVGGGLAKLEGKVIRIGNMGALRSADFDRAFAALGHTLRDLGAGVDVEAGRQAVEAALAPAASAL